MKKIIAIIMASFISVIGLTGCGQKETTNNNSEKLKIVASIFPVYDWTKEIIGNSEDVDLTLLLNSGVDLHSYQPTVEDITKISDCDIFIYIGGESDKWMTNALQQATNKNMKVIKLIDVLADDLKKTVHNEQEEEHSNDHHHEYDEHVWLSLKNAVKCCNEIAETLKDVDEEGYNNTYKANLENYITNLIELDAQYKEAVDNSNKKSLVFGDRYPFIYMTSDYGIDCYSAFVGCSAETEASFKTITGLAEKVDELNLNAVITIEKSDGKIANAIIENTKNKNQKVLVLDSMQATNAEDIKNGATYLSIMKTNLDSLKEALK